MDVKISGSLPFDAGVAMAENIVRLGDENASLRQLLRDYQEWAKEGVEAPSACNYQVWEMRYALLVERARELLENGEMK